MKKIWLVEVKSPREDAPGWGPLWDVHFTRKDARQAAKQHKKQNAWCEYRYRVRKYARVKR